MTEPDYEQLLDEETKAFIAKSLSYSVERKQAPTVVEIRTDYDAMCAEFATLLPIGLTVRNATIANGKHTIPVRWYESDTNSCESTVLIYFHGGGFVVGGLNSHQNVCADLADGIGLPVMAVAYRLAPEHPFPTALEDSLHAVRHWMDAQPHKNFILAGDSAGGWLAASISHALAKPEPRLLGQLLIYPTLGGDITKGSYITHAKAPLLTIEDILWYGEQFFGKDHLHRRIGPLCDADFCHLPPTVIFAAACDPLFDDGPAYAQKITKAGGRAWCKTENGLIHGYLRGRYHVKKIAESFSDMILACQNFKEGKWPYS